MRGALSWSWYVFVAGIDDYDTLAAMNLSCAKKYARMADGAAEMVARGTEAQETCTSKTTPP